MTAEVEVPASGRRRFRLGLVAVFVVAVTARLVPVLHGYGLGALGNYDDGVHFAAAIGLVHGLLPYRDFLLLHPPGIAVLLSPFAALTGLVGDATAVRLARLAWMCLGGVNAVGVGVVIRPLSHPAALLGGLFYAVFLPAIYSEHTVLLEAPATTALLASLAVLRPFRSRDSVSTKAVIVAGALAGISPAIKVWGVVPVLVVFGWLLVEWGWRPGLTFLAGAAAACAAFCLPFFAAAPEAMWRMVILDQSDRQAAAHRSLVRLNQIFGLGPLGNPRHVTAALVLAGTCAGAALVVCIVKRRLRLLAALMLGTGLVLASTPTWFAHYSALTAAPLALVLAGAGSVVFDWLGSVAGHRTVLIVAGAAGFALVAVAAVALAYGKLGGAPFPGKEFRSIVADTPGCIQSDMPMALIQMDVLSRNIDRGCRFEVDMSGHSYDLGSPELRRSRRASNPVWQQFVQDYLRSGNLVLIARFRTDDTLSPQTKRLINSWPTRAWVENFALRATRP